MSIVRKRPAITIPKSEGRKRPPIGIPKSKRGLIRMEQANFKTIVEMAYEMELVDYLEKVLDIHLLITKKIGRRCENTKIYYPPKKVLETIYKLFPIETQDIFANKDTYIYLESNRIDYQIDIRNPFQRGKLRIFNIRYSNNIYSNGIYSIDECNILDYIYDNMYNKLACISMMRKHFDRNK